MAALNCVELVERDQDGEILKAGAEWNESTFYGSPLGVVLRVLGFLGGALMAIIGAAMLYWASTLPGLGHFMAIISGVPGLILMAAVFRKQPKRALLFRRDGKIETPYGIAVDKSARIWAPKWNHENLTAIEGVGQDQVWRVDFIYAKGDTVTISRSLDREEARKVAIMLRDAWGTFSPHVMETA